MYGQAGFVSKRPAGINICARKDCSGSCAVRDYSPISGRQRPSWSPPDHAALLRAKSAPQTHALSQPIFQDTHSQYYYELLNNVRLTGDWEAWLDFFAEAVTVTATQAVETAQKLVDLVNRDRSAIGSLGRAAPSVLRIHRALMEGPIVTSGWLVKKTGISPATVNKCLLHLERLGIIRELTSRKRNRIFSYTGYVNIVNQGTEYLLEPNGPE